MGENKSYNDSPTFIPSRLESSVHSSIPGNGNKGPAVDAKDIYDINHGKWQSDINNEALGLKSQLDKIVVKFTPVELIVSPTLVEAGTENEVSLNAAAVLDDPEELCDKIQLMRENTVISEQRDAVELSYTDIFTPVSNGSILYKAKFTIRGIEKTKDVEIAAHYPIYYGFGADAASIATVGDKVLSDTPAGTYSGTISDQYLFHFYILVPDYMPTLTTFTSGGYTFAMEDPVQIQIGGVDYKAYESTDSFTDTELEVVASVDA